ncbi:zinc-binding dehydrogenase [Kribbella shirazensis]|uniref:alcohol dehydrogenase n=1 Tax=Kribbella shirazensis TaxID=1105143 RepID=A0A7X5VC80_9ACTN|nr:zinc-binding dehydrogenase [Kribbella shirazensis]NIK58467.1 putative phosphonate catabolism associated alcohol dehydrogenase [Kribbella shirazensis]
MTTTGSTVNATATAAVWSGVEAGFTVDTLPLPALRRGEVLVRTELATICGSDLHTINGDRPTPLPTVLGHEAIGHVVATGGDVTAADGQPVRQGDRITWTIGTACGTCRRCRRGISQKCLSVRKYGHEAIDDHWKLNGGFGTHVHLVAGTGVVKVPDQLPATVATPANCATATVTCAARRTELDADDVVVVLGCGMLGLTAVAYARDRGCSTVIASDVDPSRRELAALFGATAVVEPQDLAAITSEYGADVVFELSGNSRAVQSAFGVVDLGGRIALVGSVSPAPEISFEPSGFVKNLTTVVGCHNYRVDDLVEAVAFLGRTPAQALFADLIPAPYALADIVQAVTTAGTSSAPRIAVQFP